MNTVKAFLLTLVIVMVPSYAFSGSSHPDKHRYSDRDHKGHKRGHHHGGQYCEKDHSHDAEKVPEINAGGTAIALALLSGLVLVARERRSSDRG
ncbi:hypothetical protein [Ketobacter sp.]|uniref:hypothetical protein n=1 Tax=Ketobacter sp. TaxID=2083498 RepID=UPI000F2A8882|nr:hypothetical protein [Ketobacter sp.]RLT93654.1 MAG: hypothetical protein D9N14_18020 [Ketobacter sp.]